MLKNIGRYLRNISTHLKNLKKHFKKLKKYQYDTDYLFNEHNEEDYTINKGINALQEARKLFNEQRSSLLHEKTKRIGNKLHKKEAVYNFLKEKEQNDNLINSEKKVLKKIDRYLKNFKKDFKKLQKYQNNITYGLDYLMNSMKKIIMNQKK